MMKIRLLGWREGLRKVSATNAIRQRAAVSLAQAKNCVDRVLEGETPLINMADGVAAVQLADELMGFGMVVQVEEATSPAAVQQFNCQKPD